MPDSESEHAARTLRRTRKPAATAAPAPDRRRLPRSGPAPDDRFFRFIVSSTRNGVIAFRRDGTLALMNDEAYRIFGLERSPDDLDKSVADVLRDPREIGRLLTTAFDLSYLPNRAELRLNELDRVIGYTLSQVKNDA